MRVLRLSMVLHSTHKDRELGYAVNDSADDPHELWICCTETDPGDRLGSAMTGSCLLVDGGHTAW
jgi:hypothetical protein